MKHARSIAHRPVRRRFASPLAPGKDRGMSEPPPSEILQALHRMGLMPAATPAQGERLTGGVSSDIWRIDLPSGPICVKRALAKLAREWGE